MFQRVITEHEIPAIQVIKENVTILVRTEDVAVARATKCEIKCESPLP